MGEDQTIPATPTEDPPVSASGQHGRLHDDLLEALFNAQYRPMLRLAAWLTGSEPAAEDIVQDAFVRLARADLTAVTNLQAYLRSTVVNLTRSRGRRQALVRRHRVTELRVTPGPESLLADEQLAFAVDALPTRQRECVVLRYTDDLTVADIAAALGISEGSVKTHLHRGLSSLSETLSNTTLSDTASRQAETPFGVDDQ